GKSKSWIKVTTKTGRTITMTPHHSALVWNSEIKSLEKIKASKLEVNDKIPILSKIKLPVNKPPSYVNILKELALKLPNTDKFKNFKHQLRLRKASNWIRGKLLSYAKEVPLLSVSQKEYQRIQQNIRKFYISLLPAQPFKKPLTTKWYKSIPLSHLEILQKEGVFQWDEIPHNAVLGMARDDHIVKPFIPFTTDLMRLLGYYNAEGYIRDENTCYQTNFSVPNPILRKHVRKLIINLLGSEPYFTSDNGQLVHTGRIHAYLFAHSWKLGKGAYKKTIPNFIFNLPEEYRLEFISAFIDGNGSISKTDKSILLYSVSKKLLYDFGVLLGILGIMFRKRKPAPVGHYGKVILDPYKKLGKKPKDSIVHHIEIRGPDLRILEKLNIYNLEKRKNAERILKSGFTSKSIIKDQNNHYIQLEKEENIVLDPIRKIENVSNFDGSYCFEVETIRKSKLYNNLATSMCVTGNCDGDEDGLMLLLDPLLNFSRFYLPSKIGGRMDATLVIGTLLDPNEIDSEAHNVDTLFKYPLEFYEATERYAMPHEIEEILELVKSRLGSEGQYENIGFNIPTDDINAGPTMTAYKTYKSMDDKIEAQLHLAKIIQAVDAKKVAKKILSSHFNPDILGNLRKFAVQEFRCVKCNTKYRRPPISNNGKCPKCNNKVILTVNRGGIEKYIPRALKLCSEFNLDSYTQQRMTLIEEYVTSLTNNPKIKQQKLSDFF
ncbi:MAG: LAGLIDADG family homing endonuclease, partial [Promethearchaeota archaeon]